MSIIKSNHHSILNFKPILGAALISASFIALEILWTRIFSAEYFYTFAFLILSLSILGLGLGALTVRLSKRLSSEKHLWFYLCLGGVISIAGPVLVLQFDLNFTELFVNGLMAGKVFLVIVILSGCKKTTCFFKVLDLYVVILFQWSYRAPHDK